MIGNNFKIAPQPVLIKNVKPVGFGGNSAENIDILIGIDGRVAHISNEIVADQNAKVVDGKGAFISAGWTDLHTHIWYGGTDISIRPEQAGAIRGVTTMVDAGSAGEANFHGLRELMIEPAVENIYSFLNIGSIGLVACNRVSELQDMRSIDIDRIVACVEANRDAIVGLKVRASAVISGGWDMVPVKIAKKLGRVLKMPLMVHVGEPPPLYDDILAILTEGDIVTHCFNGKVGGSILEDEDLYTLVAQAADRGVILDVGHGRASFSFEVAKAALARGLNPHTISTDLHNRSMDGAVWDMGTTMSKLLSLGMKFEDVVHASTIAPRKAIRLNTENLLSVNAKAEFTIFDLVDNDIEVKDSKGIRSLLKQTFEPRFAVIGGHVTCATRYTPDEKTRLHSCPHCGWAL